MLCTGASHEPSRFPVRVGLNGGTLATEIAFATPAKLREQAFAFSVEKRLSPDVSLMLSPGGVLGGTISVRGVEHSISPGPLLGVGASWRVVDSQKHPYFLLFGASLSASTAQTSAGQERARLSSIDARASLILGKTFLDTLSPYGVVRAFGGPVFWKIDGAAVTAGDRYHYHLGLGLSATLPWGLDVFAELAPVGEQRSTLGLGMTF